MGIAVVIAYLFVALRLSAPPVRPMFEIIGAPAYRWVTPPPQFAAGNKRPERRTYPLPLGPHGSPALGISTGDGQATGIFPEGAFVSRADETSVEVRIDPIDPATIGPPPSGFHHDGNAYRLDATYPHSGSPATPAHPVTIVLSYPIHATRLLRRTVSGWSDLPAARAETSRQIYGPTSELGVFVADGPPLSTSAPKTFPAAIVISVCAAAAALAAGSIARLRSRRRRSSDHD